MLDVQIASGSCFPRGTVSGIEQLETSSQCQSVATGSRDRTFRIWSLADGDFNFIALERS